ncbi:DUF1289 domain-containing protein [Catenovulum sediminis]|uniref:DUF1289 domain-containing protein n=1 Tax=Catenovulum sediminis TaxID=1740262 RepID=A0ABV1RLU8_9ALTE
MKLQSTSNTQIETPCIRNCCLDEKDICIGCGRHVDEIVQWRSYSDAQRKVLMSRAKNRKQQRV